MDKKPINVLILEEDYVYYLFFKEILSLPEYSVTRALTVKDMIREMNNEEPYDFVICNFFSCGAPNHIELERLKKDMNKYRYLVITDYTNSADLEKYFSKSIYRVKNLTDMIHLNESVEEQLSFQVNNALIS